MSKEEEIRIAIAEALKPKGYELYELKAKVDKEGTTLYIVVDRPSPISLNDIVEVSDLLNPLLDELDPYEGAYTLDISSLGSEKPIKIERLGEYIGSYVHLHLSHPYKGENDLEGRVKEVNDESLILIIKDKARKKEITLLIAQVDKVRLAIEF